MMDFFSVLSVVASLVKAVRWITRRWRAGLRQSEPALATLIERVFMLEAARTPTRNPLLPLQTIIARFPHVELARVLGALEQLRDRGRLFYDQVTGYYSLQPMPWSWPRRRGLEASW